MKSVGSEVFIIPEKLIEPQKLNKLRNYKNLRSLRNLKSLKVKYLRISQNCGKLYNTITLLIGTMVKLVNTTDLKSVEH